ncbi:MAG: DNA primase [Bacteroidales bacterium]
MIDQITIDKIMDAAQIVDVVSDFVSLKKRGVNYTGLCPFHDEKKPSFSVSPSKGICKCFSCGKGGNAVHFIMEHEQLSFHEALKYLAKKYGIEIQERELTAAEQQQRTERESMLLVNAFAHTYFQDTLLNSQEGNNIGVSYFRERGFRDDIIRKFQLGYSLENREALYKEATKKGYKTDLLVKTGLVIDAGEGKYYDRFRGRVMFPVHSISGKVVAFGGRILKSDAKLAKYQNSPESEIYHKSNELYGIYFAKGAIVKQDNCFLVEGYTDVISMHQSGIENVVASSGTALTPGQIRLIHRFTDNITVLYDGDAAGMKASLRGIDLLLQEGMNVKVVLLPDGEDPDSFAQQHSASEFMQFIKDSQVDFIRFKTNLLMRDAGNDPIKKAGIIGDILNSISIIPDNVKQSIYLRETSEIMSVQEAVLANNLKQLNLKRKEAEFQKRNLPNSYTQTQVPQDIQSPFPPAPPVDGIPLPTDETGGYAGPAAVTQSYYSRFDANELAIIRLLIRYGEQPLQIPLGEGEVWQTNVLNFILSLIDDDEIEFENALYLRVLDEARKHKSNDSFQAQKFFLQHMDPEISRLAAEVSADKHILSKYHSKKQRVELEPDCLETLTQRALLELQNERVTFEFKHKIQSLNTINDPQLLTQAMLDIRQLQGYQMAISKQLGERILVRQK